MTDETRIPPHNPDAEAALLSACILYADQRRKAISALDPEDFYVSANRRVFAAITRLETRGEPVDIITVSAEVQTGDEHASVNPTHVAGYINSLGSALNTSVYCGIVADMARYRRLLNASSDLTNAVYAFDDTAICQALDALDKERQ